LTGPYRKPRMPGASATAGGEIEHGLDLLSGHRELLENFLDVGTGVQIFKDGGDWQMFSMTPDCWREWMVSWRGFSTVGGS